ncbi:MAG TPA: hypothetical protein VGX97_04865 [bacterium]|nr:hypothetical protein [bacterium]
MRRRRQVRTSRRAARRPAVSSRAAARRRSKDRAPRSTAGTLLDVLNFQAKSTAALRAVKMPMAVEPSFIFRP